jgi:uncharacterized protein YjcR
MVIADTKEGVRAMAVERGDWPELKAEYVAGSMSIRELAEKHDIPFCTLQYRSSKDKWGPARREYRKKLVETTLKKDRSRRASACVKQLQAMGRAAEHATHAIERICSDAEQFHRHLVQERDAQGAQDVRERVYAKGDTRALRELAAAMKDLVAVIRDVHGVPTLQDQATMELAREKMELDRQKAALASDVDDDETGVVILPPVQDKAGPPSQG